MGYVRIALALLALGLVGCFSPGFAARPLVQVPEVPGEQAKCKVAASHDEPLVTEWPASEKANLQASLAGGSVVVAYTGCTLRILPACRAPGSYAWRRTTTTTDTVEIQNSDELYAKLPIGAVSLEGELERSGRLAVQTTVAGQFQLGAFDPRTLPTGPECEGATHVLRALSVGAFALKSGGAAHVAANVSVANAGSGGGGARSEESLVREAGVPARCEQSDDARPHVECSSPVQMFLQPLPATYVDRGPPGSIKVKFLPVEAEQKWDVVVGDRTLCTTPCERWFDPAMPYSLKYDPGFFERNQVVTVPDLREHLADERVEVRVRPTRTAEQVLGIVVTSLAGMAVAAGTPLMAVGCGHDGAMCQAGSVSLGAGIVGLVPGIWMIVDAKAEVAVTRMQPRGP